MSRTLTALAAACALALPLPLAAQSPGAAVETITAADVSRRIGVIAADSMRGRATPSPELEQTAAWIASEMARVGLRPGGDAGSFLQRYPIITKALVPASSTAALGGVPLRFGRDVAPAYAFLLPDGERTGPLVVVSGTDLDDVELTRAALGGRHVLVVPPAGGDTRTPKVAAVVRAVLAAEPLAVWLASDRADVDWASRGNVELRRRHRAIGDPE